MSNTFEEAAYILRGLKERLDRGDESAGESGEVNVFRGVTDSTVSVDTVTTATDDSASWTWGESTWDHAEWQE